MLRTSIEEATDASQADLLAEIEDLDGITEAFEGWSTTCIEAKTFPEDARKRAAG
ncbi:hypothetical protein [Pseudonocardia pini]|uniref:hypothetical protein n=1 Tax=Pseudonocardia pini TaxID=2758030 RepID=UPI0035E42D66